MNAEHSVVQHHVKGHQDEHIRQSKLSWEAKLNVHCDKITKKALNNHLRNVRSDTHDPLMDVKFCRMLLLETARLYVNRSKQTSDIKKGL